MMMFWLVCSGIVRVIWLPIVVVDIMSLRETYIEALYLHGALADLYSYLHYPSTICNVVKYNCTLGNICGWGGREHMTPRYDPTSQTPTRRRRHGQPGKVKEHNNNGRGSNGDTRSSSFSGKATTLRQINKSAPHMELVQLKMIKVENLSSWGQLNSSVQYKWGACQIHCIVYGSQIGDRTHLRCRLGILFFSPSHPPRRSRISGIILKQTINCLDASSSEGNDEGRVGHASNIKGPLAENIIHRHKTSAAIGTRCAPRSSGGGQLHGLLAQFQGDPRLFTPVTVTHWLWALERVRNCGFIPWRCYQERGYCSRKISKTKNPPHR